MDLLTQEMKICLHIFLIRLDSQLYFESSFNQSLFTHRNYLLYNYTILSFALGSLGIFFHCYQIYFSFSFMGNQTFPRCSEPMIIVNRYEHQIWPNFNARSINWCIIFPESPNGSLVCQFDIYIAIEFAGSPVRGSNKIKFVIDDDAKTFRLHVLIKIALISSIDVVNNQIGFLVLESSSRVIVCYSIEGC